jgi:DNA-binding MarR family transcriptional regulator
MRPGEREAYAQRWGLVFEKDGLPRIAGLIWGWLLVSDPAAQTAQQLVDALDISKGSVSTDTRLLERAGLIERVPVPGSRRTHFRVRADAYETLMERKLSAVGRWRALGEEGLDLLEGTDIPAGRLEKLRRFYAFIEREQAAVMERWRNQEGD